MERILTTQIAAHIGERVVLAGWLHRLRQLSEINFLILRDGYGLAQIIVEDDALRARLAALNNESILRVEGTVVAEAQAPGGVEVRDPRVEILNPAYSAPPFDLYRPMLKATLPTILDYAPVALRHPRERALFRLAAAATHGLRATLDALGFTEIQPPKMVASATEGGANVFKINYFGRDAYLAQSPQFYKQIMVGVFERVYEVGPVFRAEPHETTRHLNEYVSLDMEMGFIENHFTVMQMLTRVLAGMLETVGVNAHAELARLNVTLPRVPDTIPHIHFRDVLELIYRATGEDARGEPDLAPAHERWLGEWSKREYDSDFLFVVGYPMVKRPFYTHPDPARPNYSNSFDLLFRGLELVTGGQRLHKYEDYIAVLDARGMPHEPFEGYLQAFRYGMPPHGGFAIGLERLIARLVGAENIRETTLFPRDMNRLTP